MFAACFAAGLGCRRIVGSTPQAGHRDRYLDGLRALAAISVLASHYGNNIAGSLGYAVSSVFHNLGTFGVQVFFAITGLLFTRKALAARGEIALAPFAAARLRRIVPMYTAAIALSIAIAVVAQAAVPTGGVRLLRESIALYAFGFVLDGSPSIRGLNYVEVIGTIWTLPFEWLFYVCVPVLAVVVRSWRCLLWSGAALALYFGNRMWDGAADVFTPFFLPGVLMGLRNGGTLPGGRRWLMGATALFLALCAILPGNQNFTPVRLMLMSGFFFAVVHAAPARLAAAGVARLGDISYSLYLLHFPALFVARAVFDSPRVALFAPYPRAAAFLGVAVLATGLAALTYRTIERPFLRRAAA